MRIYRWNPAQVVYRDEGDQGIIESMVVPFNEWIEVDSVFEGHFMERFAPGSLRKTLRENLNRIRVYFEHGFSNKYDSQPIAELKRAWEEAGGAWFNAALLEGLDPVLLSGLQRGLYGASIGAKIVKTDIDAKPKLSAHNPKGLEERTYTEVQAHDFSITPRPAYASTSVAMRSITDELTVERFLVNGDAQDKLLQILRETQEAEPTHSEPTDSETEVPAPAEDPEQVEEPVEEEKPDEPEAPEPEPEGSRATQPPHDYLSDEKEEEWRL